MLEKMKTTKKRTHFQRKTCRLCDSKKMELVVPIPATPVADAYVSAEEKNQPQELYPLDLYQCQDCGHVQLRDVVDPEILFSHYSYFSGRSAGLVKHFQEYADRVIKNNKLQQNSLVVDIGSNDGAFLRFFKEKGMRTLGVDPAQNIAKVANEEGIETIPSMFTAALVPKIKEKYGLATVVTANNVFAHADDLGGMAESIRSLLDRRGVFVFEVSYFPDVMEKMLLGTIFHEHVCYHTVRPLVSFLQRHGMELIDVERVSIQGGSIICTAQIKGGERTVSPKVAELIDFEEKRGIYNRTATQQFSQRLQELRKKSDDLIKKLSHSGKTFAAYGASRGGTLLTYYLGLGETMQFIVDDSPEKQNLYSPGHHLPVLPTKTIYEQKPDYTFILAWVHSKPIIASNQEYLQNGGKFITFFPELAIIDRDSI